jgi:uncharacterized protein (TIRG00374 family)
MSRFPRSLKRVAMLLLFLLVVEYLVLPQLGGVGQALHLLGDVNVAYLLAGVALELAAIAAYAKLTHAVLPVGQRPSWFTVLRINLSTLAVSHIVPGGSAAGGGVGFRLLTATGVRGTDAGFALATQGLGSAAILNVVLWIGLLVSIPLRGFNPLYVTAAIAGALLIGGFTLAVLLLTRGEERVATIVCHTAARLPFLDEDAVNRTLHRVAARLRLLGTDRRLLARACGWAVANWLLDAASLWVFLAAFGYRADAVGVIVAFGLANVLAAIPLTPGGLGVVEAILTSTLVGFGAPRDIALLGVITYRFVNFWLPIPVGALAYLSLHVGPASTRSARAAALRREAEQSLAEAEDTRHWAQEHGIRVPGPPAA